MKKLLITYCMVIEDDLLQNINHFPVIPINFYNKQYKLMPVKKEILNGEDADFTIVEGSK